MQGIATIIMEKEVFEIYQKLTKNTVWSQSSQQVLIAASNLLVAEKIQNQNEIYEKLLNVNTELLEIQKKLLKRV